MIDPESYDFSNDQNIDPEERYARDIAQLDLSAWARFRWAIHIGHHTVSAPVLKGEGLDPSVIDTYRDIGKAQYQAVSQLAEAHMCLILARNYFASSDPLSFTMFFKSVSEFYFHIGASWDAIGRLIYIVCDKDSATEKTKLEGEDVTCRKRMNFYMLRYNRKFNTRLTSYGFREYVEAGAIKRIVNIRDALTHAYKIPFRDWKWPEEAETLRWLAWPHGEEESHGYHYVHSIPDKMQQHFGDYAQHFNVGFKMLLNKIAAWESTNRVLII